MNTDVSSGIFDIAEALRNSTKAAAEGVEKTKEMSAKKDRATYMGSRSIGHVDAGAQAISVFLNKINTLFFN